MQTSFSDMNPCLPSNGTPTRQSACKNEQQRDGSLGCTCTTETLDCSIHPRGKERWIASMLDSLARIFQSPVMAQALKESEADCGLKSSVLLAKYNRGSCSWKTAQLSLLADSDEFSETWPTWGSMRNGVCYQRPQLVRRTYALDGGVLQGVPTPTVCGNYNRKGASKTSGDGIETWAKRWPTPTSSDGTGGPGGKRQGGMNLRTAIQKWPTPTRRDYKSGKFSPEAKAKRDSHTRGKPLSEVVGGQLNPDWTEWLMGWPIGATELKHSETDKSRSKRRRPMSCSMQD